MVSLLAISVLTATGRQAYGPKVSNIVTHVYIVDAITPVVMANDEEQAVGREERAQQGEEEPDHREGEEEREDRLADHAPAPVQVERVLGGERGVRQERKPLHQGRKARPCTSSPIPPIRG